MRKILFLLIIMAPFMAGAQNLCLQTMCNAVRCRAGDTAILAALLTANNKVAAITFTQATGPNTAIMGTPMNGWATNLADTSRVPVSGLTAGTYTFNVAGKDLAGGVVNGVDSIIVSPAVVCPVCPPARTATAIQVFVFGQWLTLPPGAAKISYSDGTTQNY